jgi:hypothetical protein
MDYNRRLRHKPNLSLTTEPKTHDGEKTVSSTNVFGKTGISASRKLKLYPSLSPCINVNSKWIKDLNPRPETLKQLQEEVGNTKEHIGIGDKFLNRTQMVQHLRERMNTWECTTLESFCIAKEQLLDSRDCP